MRTEENTIEIDITPSDDGFCKMANFFLDEIYGCIKEKELDKAKLHIDSVLEIYRYLYQKGYRHEEIHHGEYRIIKVND